MPSEPPNYEAHGVLVLAREIITNGRTIHFRDIRDIRIQRYGPSTLTWFAMGMLLALAGAAVVYGFATLAGETLVLLLLGGSGPSSWEKGSFWLCRCAERRWSLSRQTVKWRWRLRVVRARLNRWASRSTRPWEKLAAKVLCPVGAALSGTRRIGLLRTRNLQLLNRPLPFFLIGVLDFLRGGSVHSIARSAVLQPRRVPRERRQRRRPCIPWPPPPRASLIHARRRSSRG